jgi:ribosomal subunit interface protein
MKTKFLFNNVNVSARTRVYIEKRLVSIQKLLKTKEMQGGTAEVEIDKDKRSFYRVELMVRIPGISYRSEEMSETIEGGIDKVEEEIKRQIRDGKEKEDTLMKRGARSIKKKLTIDEEARF